MKYVAAPSVKTYEPLVLSVALTGAVPSKSKYQNLPTSVEEIVSDALLCAEHGASIVHIHTRDSHGNPVHSADLMGAVISGIRSENKEVIICATTSSRGASHISQRLEVFSLDPHLLPDLASITLGSYNTPTGANLNPIDEITEIASAMMRTGVRPEAEIFEPGMIATLFRLLDEGAMPSPALVNFILGVQGASEATAHNLSNMVQTLGPSLPWGAAGIGHFQKPMAIIGAVMGGNIRVGLEDDPRGERPDWTNLDAVRRAARIAEMIGRDLASPAQARGLLRLSEFPA